MTATNCGLLGRFEAFEIKPNEFRHEHHVQVAFEMLCKYRFMEACTKYANTINTMAIRAGAPEKFNVTITLAFLSLIAQRMGESEKWTNFGEFIACNEDLLSKNALNPWYTAEQLQSEFARTHFLLPQLEASPSR